MKVTFYYFAFFCLLAASCRKDVGKDPSQTRIVMGRLSGVHVTPLDSVTSVDLNGDGNADLSITTESVKIPGAYAPKVTLHIINNALQVERQANPDTLFYNKRVNFSSTKYNDTLTELGKVTLMTHTCQRLAANDSIEDIIDTEHLYTFHQKGDEVKSGSRFTGGDAILAEPGYSHLIDKHGTWPDTVYYTSELFMKDCSSRPTNEKNYLCFVLTTEGREQIGWIRFYVSYPDFRIVETAITH